MDEDENTVGGLGSVQAPENPGNAKDLYSLLMRRREGAAQAVKDIYKPQFAEWDRYAEELKQRRLGPSKAEQLFALSAALAQPTKYRGIGAVAGNVAPVMAKYAGERRAAEQTMADLMSKYRLARAGVESQQAKDIREAETDLDTLLVRYQTAMMPKVIRNADGTYTVLSPMSSMGQGAEPPASLPANFFGED